MTDADNRPSVAGQVERPVRPLAWLGKYRSGGEFLSFEADPMSDPHVKSAFPLVLESAVISAVADERARGLKTLNDARGAIAYELTRRLIIDMPTSRALVDAAVDAVLRPNG